MSQAVLPRTDSPSLQERAAGVSGESSPKRRAILDAAESLFLDHGYGAVSMDAVARQASVSKATLYAYFTSKDELFATIVAERGLSYVLDESLFRDDPADLRAALLAIGGAVLRFLLQPRTLAIYRIAVAESMRFPELGRAFLESGPHRCLARFAAWLERQDLPLLVSEQARHTAAMQFTALIRSGVFLRASLGVPPVPDDVEIEATVAAAVDTWMAAYGRPRESQPA